MALQVSRTGVLLVRFPDGEQHDYESDVWGAELRRLIRSGTLDESVGIRAAQSAASGFEGLLTRLGHTVVVEYLT